MSALQTFSETWLPRIETAMAACVSGSDPFVADYYGMMCYHLGFADEQFRPARADGGKRIRPLLCLMASAAVGGVVEAALPAAVAVELLHNFSLVHDDIQDNSPTRRHRPTVWTLWGAPQGINVGDGLFVLAHKSLLHLSAVGVPPERTLLACQVFWDTCMALTEGQFMDMRFEARSDVTMAEYLRMIGGKTAALLAACCRLGGIVAGAPEAQTEGLTRFGRAAGIAFQLEDDLLGIWGDEARTGKSTASDILTRKKTLPVLIGLAQTGPLADELRARYAGSELLTEDDARRVQALLDATGAHREAVRQARQAHDAALNELQALAAMGADVSLLSELAATLLGRAA